MIEKLQITKLFCNIVETKQLNMKKRNFKNTLKGLINDFGYWSEEVKCFNVFNQSILGYHVWIQWHNEARAELK